MTNIGSDSRPEQHIVVRLFGLKCRNINLCDVSEVKKREYIEGRPPFRIGGFHTDCQRCLEILNELDNELDVESSIRLR